MRAGKVNSVQSVSTAAPMSDSCFFAWPIDAEIAASRSTGSLTSVASEVSIAEIRLPPVESASVRTDIGTNPTRG